MKTIGILGGVGPETTSKVYHSIIDSFRKNKKDKYPAILIYNLPFPFAIENEAIVKGKNSHKMIPYLISGAKILEASGADFGILPCNTLHKHIEEICSAVKIPFLNILDETVAHLKGRKIQTLGILATETTVKDKLYDNVLNINKINFFYPSPIDQASVNEIILELLNGEKNKIQYKKIQRICESLQEKGAEAILLACTDLQLIMSAINISIPIVDSTEIIIQASIRELNNKKTS